MAAFADNFQAREESSSSITLYRQVVLLGTYFYKAFAKLPLFLHDDFSIYLYAGNYRLRPLGRWRQKLAVVWSACPFYFFYYPRLHSSALTVPREDACSCLIDSHNPVALHPVRFASPRLFTVSYDPVFTVWPPIQNSKMIGTGLRRRRITDDRLWRTMPHRGRPRKPRPLNCVLLSMWICLRNGTRTVIN